MFKRSCANTNRKIRETAANHCVIKKDKECVSIFIKTLSSRETCRVLSFCFAFFLASSCLRRSVDRVWPYVATNSQVPRKSEIAWQRITRVLEIASSCFQRKPPYTYAITQLAVVWNSAVIPVLRRCNNPTRTRRGRAWTAWGGLLRVLAIRDASARINSALWPGVRFRLESLRGKWTRNRNDTWIVCRDDLSAEIVCILDTVFAVLHEKDRKDFDEIFKVVTPSLDHFLWLQRFVFS